jgi:hypothetical protein
MRPLHHNGLTTEGPRRLEAEIRSIARHWLGPSSAETLVRGGHEVLRAMAVARTLAGITMTRAVGRIREDMGVVGWTSWRSGLRGARTTRQSATRPIGRSETRPARWFRKGERCDPA